MSVSITATEAEAICDVLRDCCMEVSVVSRSIRAGLVLPYFVGCSGMQVVAAAATLPELSGREWLMVSFEAVETQDGFYSLELEWDGEPV